MTHLRHAFAFSSQFFDDLVFEVNVRVFEFELFFQIVDLVLQSHDHIMTFSHLQHKHSRVHRRLNE